MIHRHSFMHVVQLLCLGLLFSVTTQAGDTKSDDTPAAAASPTAIEACPAGTHAEGAAPPAGFELRCLDAEGRAEGVWRNWYDDGQLMSERSMKQGREHGRQRSWWPNGQLMMDGISINGSRVQGFRFWSITGQPSKLPPLKPATVPATKSKATTI